MFQENDMTNVFGQSDEGFRSSFDNALARVRATGGESRQKWGVNRVKQQDYDPPMSMRGRVIGTVLATCMLVALIAVPMWMMNERGLFGGGEPEETVLMPGSAGTSPADSRTKPIENTPIDTREWQYNSDELAALSDSYEEVVTLYGHLGLSVDKTAALMMYEGHPVREIWDPVTGFFMAESIGPEGFGGRNIIGGIDLTVAYEKGVMVGLAISTQEEYDKKTEDRRWLRRWQDALFNSDAEELAKYLVDPENAQWYVEEFSKHSKQIVDIIGEHDETAYKTDWAWAVWENWDYRCSFDDGTVELIVPETIELPWLKY